LPNRLPNGAVPIWNRCILWWHIRHQKYSWGN